MYMNIYAKFIFTCVARAKKENKPLKHTCIQLVIKIFHNVIIDQVRRAALAKRWGGQGDSRMREVGW
jgi:hypothetical protein